MLSSDLRELEVFYGEASTAAARIYAQLPRDVQAPHSPQEAIVPPSIEIPPGDQATAEDLTSARLHGQVVGPFSELARTLPAVIPLRDVGPGHTIRAEALAPDPCFWTPEAPYVYRIDVELRRDSQVLGAARRWVGIRPLGIVGRRLKCDGRNFVLRGLLDDSLREPPISADMAAWREAGAALVARQPDDEVCRAASEQGVLIVARLSATAPDLVEEVTRLRQFPAVGMLLIEGLPPNVSPASEPLSDLIPALRALARNMVLLQHVSADAPWPQETACQALACEVDSLESFLQTASASPHCVLAMRPLTAPGELSVARAACDALQASLAGSRHLAGYLV